MIRASVHVWIASAPKEAEIESGVALFAAVILEPPHEKPEKKKKKTKHGSDVCGA